MAVSSTQLKRLQSQVEKLRAENLRLKKRLRQSSERGKQTSHRASPQTRPVVKLGGLWAGTPEITEQDIAQARRDAWRKFGERDL